MLICAWCKKKLETRDYMGSNSQKTGICAECVDMLKTKYKITALFDLDDIETIKNFLAEKTTR